MKIAIPLANEKSALHFGHCERFAFFDVDPETRTFSLEAERVPPPHEPGVLPRWLAECGTELIFAGGMGQRAQTLFLQQGIRVLLGVPSEKPERLIEAYLNGTLETGSNACDH